MSDEGKFRLSVVLNASIVLGIVIGFFGLWTTLVQKYDEIVIQNKTVLERIDTLQKGSIDLSGSVADVQRRVEAQSQHLLLDEQRINSNEGKIDAALNMLNQFLIARSGNHVANPSPDPVPASQEQHQ